MMRIVLFILSPMLRGWATKHEQIDPVVLVSSLNSAVVDFGSSFTRKDVLVPTWEMIQEPDPSINWVAFLEKP